MKADFLNPFVDGATYVMKQVLSDGGIKRGTLSLRSDPVVSSGVATLVGISGRLEGHVIFDMDRKTAMAISSVMNGEEMPGVNNIVRSTINEMANMIAGNATTRLADAGYACNITPPTFIVGSQSEIYAHKGAQHLVVPLETACGTVVVSLALAERA